MRSGSRRRVEAKFGGRIGWFRERRIIHESNRRMAFVIEAETFGLFRFLENVGSPMQLEPAGPGRTRVTWTFFHDTRGPIASAMNRLVVLRQQRANRLRAQASVKAWVEEQRLASGAIPRGVGLTDAGRRLLPYALRQAT